jgi:hypothetical protein
MNDAQALSQQLDQLRFVSGDFPRHLHELRTRAADAKRAFRTISKLVDDREAIVALDVKMERDSSNKAVFPNDEARKAETARRLASDDQYRSLSRTAEDHEINSTNAALAVQRAEDEYRSHRDRIEMTVAEVHLLINLKP